MNLKENNLTFKRIFKIKIRITYIAEVILNYNFKSFQYKLKSIKLD